MDNINERKEQLAAYIQQQNEDPNVNSLLQFLKLSHLMDKYLDATIGVHGLNRTQRRIISFIQSKNESMTPTELSKLSLLTIDAVNKSIDNLDKLGLTRSYRSKKDRRARRVSLTEKGLEFIEKSMPLRHETFSTVMNCLSEREIKIFTNYMQRLIDQINSLTEKDNAPAAPDVK